MNIPPYSEKTLERAITHGQETELLRIMDRNGVTITRIKYLLTYPKFATKIFEPIAAADMYEYFLGSHYFGMKEWGKHYNIETKTTLPPLDEDLGRSTCPIETCRVFSAGKIYETHFLYWVPERIKGKRVTLQMLTQDARKPTIRVAMTERNPSYERFERLIMQKVCTPGWHFVYLGSVPHSNDMTWKKQVEFIPKGYAPATTVELALAYRLFAINNHQPDNPHIAAPYVRCVDQSDDGLRAAIGMPTYGKEIVIRFDSDDYRSKWLGISASRVLSNLAE